MTGRVAETLQRRWLAFELDNQYLQASKFRFEFDSPLVVNPLPIEKTNKQKVFERLYSKLKDSPLPQNSKMLTPSSSHQLSLPFINEFMEQRKLKFTYGHQFEPEKFSLL